MVADELAFSLVQEHVLPGARVLDPFCGSGRLLAAASHAGLRVGVDANPLAWLLTKAKLAHVNPEKIALVLDEIGIARRVTRRGAIRGREDRRVEWFSPEAERELGRIVAWLNGLRLAEPERLLIAAALSATVREVSFARPIGWKLHRVDAATRLEFKACPWERLARRLQYCLRELRHSLPIEGDSFVELADARSLSDSRKCQAVARGPYEVVLTSPPYGDSRSTVQYGAASALCLSVVGQLEGLEHLLITGGAIDSVCLGGRQRHVSSSSDLKRYWAGSVNGAAWRAVATFLADYDEICDAISASLNPGGTAVLVVGRRSTGGYRLKLDDFTVSRLEARGFVLVSRQERALRHKRLPTRVNRFARSQCAIDRARGIVNTMASEVILVLKKRNRKGCCRPHGDP
jgi:site-specific DNA-methyltransferase (cytosine-N4-specific)